MPLTGINSYPPTVELFQEHWERVNASQPSTPIVLADGTTLADFTAMQSAMTLAFAAVAPAAQQERTAAGDLAFKRQKIQPRYVQWNQAIRFYLGKTRLKDATFRVPTATDGLLAFQTPGENILKRWQEINTSTDLAPFQPPLKLPDFSDVVPAGGPGYDDGHFGHELSAVVTAFSTDTKAAGDATQVRSNRNALLPPLREAMKNYREACLLLLPKNSPFLPTLPRLTPLPGTTPPALVATGSWDAVLGKARCEWTGLTPEDVAKFGITHIQVRGCLGAYKSENEEVVTNLLVTDTHWEGDWGLTAPGSDASFKFYAMTATGNEAGGKAVRIVRPTG